MGAAIDDELFHRETLQLIDQLMAADTERELVKTVAALRAAGHPLGRVHHALEQVRLRRKAQKKFGEFAHSMLFTERGLEQATRLQVAAHHAGRFRDAGITSVADLGCGIGADSMAFAALGLTVLAVEKDPLTAAAASYNLASFDTVTVVNGDLLDTDLGHIEGLWLDPARRNDTSRLSKPTDWSPTLTEAFALAALKPTGIKLAPGMDRALIPDNVEAQWVSVAGEVVEMVLWWGLLATKNVTRSALLITQAGTFRMENPVDSTDAPTAELGRYLYEPDGAVIRARLIGDLARKIDGWMLDPTIAYISSNELVDTPFAQAFEVEQVLPLKTRELTKWAVAHEVGELEIKKRGVDIDPASLRSQLSLSGSQKKTLILTRAGGKKIAIATRRVQRDSLGQEKTPGD